MTQFCTNACGKIMVAGEYAVLFGGNALIVPSAQKAQCTFTPGDAVHFSASAGRVPVDDSLFAAVVKTASAAGIAIPTGHYHLDTSAFFHPDGQKYGLGSSAAATVALIKMIFERSARTDRQSLLEFSLQCHREYSQGLGSGADVAAAVYGAPIQFHISSSPTVETLTPHQFLRDLLVIGTPTSQNTRDFVKKAFLLRSKSRSFLHDFITASTKNTLTVTNARNETDFINAMHELYQWLMAFGAHAKIDIISKSHANIHRLARMHGGAAKPSGAGGGDIAIAYVPKASRQQFLDELDKTSAFVIAQD